MTGIGNSCGPSKMIGASWTDGGNLITVPAYEDLTGCLYRFVTLTLKGSVVYAMRYEELPALPVAMPILIRREVGILQRFEVSPVNGCHAWIVMGGCAKAIASEPIPILAQLTVARDGSVALANSRTGPVRAYALDYANEPGDILRVRVC